MATVNLEKMSFVDLQELQKTVETAIRKVKTRERAEVKDRIQQMLAQRGMTLQDLLGAPRKRTASTVKFVNPHNPNQTWSGRGRRPHWYKDESSQSAA